MVNQDLTIIEWLQSLNIDVSEAFGTEVDGKPAIGLPSADRIERVTQEKVQAQDPAYIAYLREWFGKRRLT